MLLDLGYVDIIIPVRYSFTQIVCNIDAKENDPRDNYILNHSFRIKIIK